MGISSVLVLVQRNKLLSPKRVEGKLVLVAPRAELETADRKPTQRQI